ncbi:hypothetical protein A2W13_02655 [Candidatus Woesebacteria bacterium RBG_16_36_11]|uniref:Uncharacterized protein n=3 Tax=Candidatus Woeseibacteriota TaxID=1752722 RepID=A0A1F7X9M3_9BACT|nr:MAG: hypothetical protein A2Z67_05670 [Candidatus Woesebacteria bacterium RBG_13_36_22]OGM11068.1 MAG: hypothetical protein A2W13_02655 [Candidatus Woesebacteria bacterium RBG_16_36_11]OGM17129.1 MAG: hypothetical protein A2V55_00280 [Candidatus Woesebacteria bacterium RBG_19FT_COMBO_37_29]
MFTLLAHLKYSFSHINSKDWHWKIVSLIWGKRASRGSACPYYWFKLPTSLLILLIGGIIMIIWMFFRGLTIVFMWIGGYQFKRDFKNPDHAVTERYSYSDYKERKDGSYIRFAPWQYLIIPIALVVIWYLGFVNQKLALTILLVITALTIVTLLAYVLSKGWKNQYVQQARNNVSDAWHRVCPPLYIDGEKDYHPHFDD